MYNPWFRRRFPPNHLANRRNDLAFPPWFLPAMAGHPAVHPDHSDSGELIPRKVRAVAEVETERPSVPTLPISYVAWSPEGRYLLYIGGPGPRAEHGPLMLLDMNEPGNPRPVAQRPLYGGLAWHPAGDSFVYTRMDRGPGGRLAPTIFQQRLTGGEPVNLLPQEVTPPLNVAFIHRWLDERTLAFDESVGTAMRRAFLLDAVEGRLVQTPELVATTFTWAPTGDRLAGQGSDPLSPTFWIWDRLANRFLIAPRTGEDSPLPGVQQHFEAWSPDGRSALFTAWTGRPYRPGSRPTLYRLDLTTGETTRLAEGAAFAAWSGDWIAYVRDAPRFTLVVTRAADNQVRWTDDLGPPPQMDGPSFPWTFWPRMVGPYLAYRTTAGDWLVSRADRKEVERIYRGELVSPFWSPTGRQIALLHTNEGAFLVVLANPLWQPQTEPAPGAIPSQASPLPLAQEQPPGPMPGPPPGPPPPPDVIGLPPWLREPQPVPWPPWQPGPIPPPELPPWPGPPGNANNHPWLQPPANPPNGAWPTYWPWWQ